MPLYEFQCPACALVVERLQKFTDGAPTCHGTPFEAHDARDMARIYSRTSFAVKGFCAMNGYSGPRTFRNKIGNIRTEVTGNFEAFSDGLHK